MKRSRTRIRQPSRANVYRRRLQLESLEARQLLAAGPYAPAAGQAGSTAIAYDDEAIVGWARQVADYSPGTFVTAEWSDANQALGPAQGEFDRVVSLGRGGSLTLTFDPPIRDGLGPDFAVFENSFSDTFLELGYVEVSSDGVNFTRFVSDSRTPSSVGSFGELDPTNLNNLVGKYRGGFGVPFDLAEHANASSLDVTAVTHVRLVDIIGNGNSLDGQGDPIFDPTPTSQSAGLDVDGVAALNQVQYGNIVVDLETLGDGLGDAVFDNGASAGGSFEEQEISLNNDYSSQFDSWRGFSISQAADTTTAGFTNQYSAITGSGRLGSETYAVGFYDSSATDNSALPTIELDETSGSQFDSLWVTNTTYAALSMRDGDMFAKKFGGTSGNDPDFLQLSIVGVNGQGIDVGTVDVMLADFRFAINNQDFILENWRLIDLTSLIGARSLRFEMTSSDVGPFGINTPAYVAVDDITLRRAAVPFDVSAIETSESDSVTGRITRPSGNTSTPLTVSLEGAGSDAVTFPESVTIPAGAMFIDFAITPDADSFASGNRTVEITATADNLLPTTHQIEIVDDESASIGFSQPTVTVTEGAGEDAATLTLRRNDADISLPLSVTLGVDGDTNLLDVPTTLVFESGEREATVSIGARDNEDHSSGTEVTVRATAAGRLPATMVVRVLEDDLPTLITNVNDVTVRESNPGLAASITLRRNVADLSEPLDVTLFALDAGPVEFPAQVMIPANQSSVVFQVSALDDDFANQNETVRLQMTNPNYVSAIVGVQVADNDAATVLVTFTDETNQPLSELLEGSIANVTVSRTTANTSGALDVALAYSLGERVVGPNATAIPDGSRSQTFSIRVLSDNLSTGDIPLVVEAEVVGLQTGRGEISVQDADLPSLHVSVEGGSLSEANAISQGDFENLGLAMTQGEFINNAGEARRFSSGPFELANSFDDSFGFDSWSGFSISQGVDDQTPGFGNQYSAITGGGADDSPTYAVGFASSPVTIERDSSQGNFHSFAVTNTTFAAISMRDGDDFAKEFGGETGDDPDFLLLTINGLNNSGESIGVVEFYLADYRFADNENDTIVDEWTTVDLSSIASAQTLSMQLSSSDNGSFGMNTPAYFAIDNLRLLPDASSLPTVEVKRQTDGIAEPLDVNLSHDRDDLWLPNSATIAAGQDSVSVPLAWWGNDVVDAAKTWTVAASGAGVQPTSETIELVDDDTSKLSVQVSADMINESAGVVLADMEDAGQFLMPESVNNGVNQRGGFTSQGVAFATDYNTGFGSWSGWAVANVTDVTTPGFTNQYSAYADVTSDAPGGGADGSQTFAIANGYGPTPPTLDLGQVEVDDQFADAAFRSVAITNTTYAALSMRNGDDFAKRFGGGSGDDPDFFLLTIDGVDGDNESLGTVEFYLADYRFEDNTDDYIVDDWTTVDLSSLAAASKLTFSLSSSDVGAFGMNTPAYFALDNLLLSRADSASESVVVHRSSLDVSEPLAIEVNVVNDDRLTIAPQIIIPAGAAIHPSSTEST